MIDFLLFIFGSVGFTIVFVYSSVFERVRDFLSFNKTIEELLHCAMCFGFWVGLTTSYIYGYDLFCGAFTISLISWLLLNVCSYFITETEAILSELETEEEEEDDE